MRMWTSHSETPSSLARKLIHLKLEIAQALKSAADDLGIEMEVYEDYSGRNMYGHPTAAVIYEKESDLMKAAALAVRKQTENDPDCLAHDMIDELPERRDNLGNDLLAY